MRGYFIIRLKIKHKFSIDSNLVPIPSQATFPSIYKVSPTQPKVKQQWLKHLKLLHSRKVVKAEVIYPQHTELFFMLTAYNLNCSYLQAYYYATFVEPNVWNTILSVFKNMYNSFKKI